MNIVIKTYNGYTLSRPDTTWERYNRDCYTPDDVKSIGWVPIVYGKIIRPGKCIQGKFAKRYYDSCYRYGILLFPDESGSLANGANAESYAQACCYDHSSFLADPVPEELKEAFAEPFTLLQDGKEVFRTGIDAQPLIGSAIESVSKRTLVRNGDYVALELAPMQFFPPHGTVNFCGFYDTIPDVPLINFNVIMQ